MYNKRETKMGKKKTKQAKKSKKRVPKEDVKYSTTLPPAVEGQLRCFLRVSITKIDWMVAKPPDVTHVRLKWWGEGTDGTVFRPLDMRNPQKSTSRTIARFPVRCGPKQFTAYLNDMGTLLLEVLKGTAMIPLGKVHINEIGHLAPQIPINGFFPVFSNKDPDKIADLHVSMAFEPLPTSYDSSSSMPTTDVSVATGSRATDSSLKRQHPHPLYSAHQSQPHPTRKVFTSVEGAFVSPVKQPPFDGDRRIPTPRGIDSDYSFVIGPGADRKTSSRVADVPLMPETTQEPGVAYNSASVPASRYQDEHQVEYSRPRQRDTVPTRTSRSQPGFTGQHLQINPGSKTGQDLITALLDRGTKLRDAMVVSEVQPQERRKTEIGTDSGVGVSLPERGPRVLRRSSSGDLFREILDVDDKEQRLVTLQGGDKEESFNTEMKAVELLVGDQLSRKELNSLKALQAGTSPTSSVSSHSDGDISEPEDPVHDTSILEELFYKGLRSSSDDNLSDLLSSDSDDEKQKKKKSKKERRRSITPDINDPGNRRPPSRKSSLSSRHDSLSTTPPTSDRPTIVHETRHGDSEHINVVKPSNRISDRGEEMSSDSETGSLSRMSDGSHVSFDGPQEDEVKVSPSDGLSVERLTLLGKVHIARVMVDTLSLESRDDSPTGTPLVRSNKASRMRGKPPRPVSRAKKKSYFVEYQFPVVASSRDKSLVNTMATEVMRLVSKKITDSGASFGHRSVFPVSFNGSAVDRWWKQMVVFKVFSRTPGQKTPTFLGVSSLRLRDVLQSPDLAIHQELPVRDKSSNQRYSHSSRSSEEDSIPRDSASVIGNLKVTIELGSDNKDFSMALARTKLAEMRGAKIVPLPSDQQKLPLTIPTSASSTASSKKKKTRTSQGIQTEQDQPEVIHSGIPVNVQNDMPSSSSSNIQKSPLQEEVIEHGRQPRGKEVFRDEDGPAGHARQQVQYGDRTEPAISAQPTEHEGLTLHSLLLIPEGRGITMQGVVPVVRSDKYPQLQPAAQVSTGWSGWGHDRDRATRNTYLVCRTFWSDDSVRSDVCWGTSEPNYNFIQVGPVLLTASLLERTRNNVMVIEVWDKKTSAQNDLLVGIAKVSLHQFYMSFRDRRIANTLLKSQYPVVAVDNYVNITDPFSGVQYGQIKVLLALGSMEQVSSLQRLKCDNDMVAEVRPERPLHYLERGESSSKRDATDNVDNMMEHVFEVVVEGVRGMTQLDDTYWGEADCFVQYHFPSQPQEQGTVPGKPTQAGAPVLRPHRTATTLCVPDPTFHDVTRHRIVLPQGIPAQRELLTACAGVGGGAGGIPFEVWCRYYYPNIRDQVAAKALLPLAKLCAMVTMQRRGEPSVQTFSLPLKMQHVEDDNLTPEQKAKIQDAGLLDVTISYKNAVIRESTRDNSASKPGGPHVCLSVGVLRACGLKMAATHLAQFDAGMQYASEVGVNAYVNMELSFLAKEDMRISRTIARTFAPEFSHHVDFPCPLLLTDGDNDTVSLAEALETAEMKLQVWHQTPGFRPEHGTDYRQLDPSSGATVSGRQLVPGSVDVLLGTAVIPLYSMLTHRTGIQGWIPLSIPSQGWAATHTDPPSPSDTPKETASHRGLERIGGGLELSIKFAHPNDRERMVDAARSVGWSPQGIVDDVEIWKEDQDVTRSMMSEVTVHTDAAWFPDYTALRPGQDTMETQAKAYIRYKFYDKAAICSKLCYLDINEDRYITADFKHAQRFQAAHTQPFAWYLREERLEIQLWISYNQDHPGQDQPRPRHRDKLIGCAYVDLSPLTDKRSKHHRVSGLYPLFKPGASNLGGACIRVHVNLKTSHRTESRQEDLDTTDDISVSANREHPQHANSGLHQRHRSMDKQRQVEDWLEDEQAQEMERQRKAREEEERRKAEEDALRNRPVSMKVLMERAMHLPSVQDATGLQTCQPSCYVTFQSAEEPSLVQTPTIPCSSHPTWGFEANVKISKEVLENQCFILKVWHQTGSSPDMGSDRVLGFCSIDMGPLLAGFRSLNGWYNIMDFSGQCHGQIKVSITPSESLSPLKKPPKQRTLTMSPNTSAVFIPGLSYVIPHPVPPSSHQFDRNSGIPSSGTPLTATGQSHFQEHLQNIRKFHQDLQDRLKSHLPHDATGQSGDDKKGLGQEREDILSAPEPTISSVTSSFLVQNLRKNLQELDIVHQKLQQRLSTSDIHTKERSEPSQREPRTVHQSSGKNPQLGYDDKGDLSSESNSIASERTRNINANHKRGSIEDLNFQDGVASLRKHNQDMREPPRRRSQSELSEDWEDSVQFGDVDKPQGEDHRDMLHQCQDEASEEDASDVVIPKALNDVSSANFGNGLGMGFQHAVPDAHSVNYQEHDPLFVRLNEDTNLMPGDRIYDVERNNPVVGVDGRDVTSLGDIGELQDEISRQRNDQSADHMNRDTHGQSRNYSESADSVDENRSASQEHLSSRTTHSGTLSLDRNKSLESDRDMTRILTDATNRQHLGDVDREPDDLANKLTAESIVSHANLSHKKYQELPENRDAAKDDVQDDSLPVEIMDPRSKLLSRQLSDTSETASNTNNSSKHIQDPTLDTDSFPRNALSQRSNQALDTQTYRKDNEEFLQRQRSLSWSSEDSVVLTLDPEVAKRQQKYVEERRAVNPVEASKLQSDAPMPNFFLPPQDLEASMRALHNAVTFLPRPQPREGATLDVESSNRTYQKSQAAAELTSRLGGSSTVPIHQTDGRGSFGLAKKPKYNAPSADEAKRIAKIFGSKYSMPF